MVWYNTNSHRNGRNLAENRTNRASRPSLRISRYTSKSIILYHKSQIFKHFGVLMTNKESIFAGLHILMPAIPDGPADAGCRLCRYWYRESRCQVRIGWQKPLWLHSFAKSAKSASKKSMKSVVRNPFNQRNPWLINDLRACKLLYICRDSSTDIESSLQIRLFMQNKANFRKVKLNVNKVLTRDYDKKDTWWSGKTKPIQSQFKAN